MSFTRAHTRTLASLAALAIALLSLPAAAVHAQTPAQQQQSRWGVAIDLGFTSSSGNTELTALTTGLRIRHLQTRHFKFEWITSYRYGESQGEVVARHAQSKLDFDMGADPRYAPFISASVERDPFRRIDLRSRTGTGVRYAFYRGGTGEASARASVLYSHERFTAGARPAQTHGTFSFELKGAQQIGEAVKIEGASSFDPVANDFRDYIVDVKSRISSRITRRLALTLSHALSYDSTPAPDVERLDQRLQAGITVEF